MTLAPQSNAGNICWVRDNDMVFRRFGDEMVLVPVRRGLGDLNSFYVLNEVGYFLWEQLVEPVTLDELVERVSEDFDVSHEDAQVDVESFIGELVTLKAVKKEREDKQ